MRSWKNVNQILDDLVVTLDLDPVMSNLKADIVKYRLPFKEPIAVNQHSITAREGFILSLHAGGRIGYGEIAPLPGFSRETLDQAAQQLLKFCKAVNNGLSLRDIDNSSFLRQFSIPSVAFGIESAIWWLQQEEWLTPQGSAPLLQGDIQNILSRLHHWQGFWPSEFKVKTGRHLLDEDIGRIQQIIQLLPESVKIKYLS